MSPTPEWPVAFFDDDDNERVLAGIARALRPGGRVFLEMMNRDWLLTHPQQRTWTQRDDGALLRRHGLDVTDVTGGASGGPYSTDSRRLAIVAERRA